MKLSLLINNPQLISSLYFIIRGSVKDLVSRDTDKFNLQLLTEMCFST